MSRSGYWDDCDFENWATIRWRGAVTAAIRGKRGQAFLKELLAALDALPEKRLIDGELKDEEGDVCALGAVCAKRGIDTTDFDMEDDFVREPLGEALGIAPALAAEIMWENDGWVSHDDSDVKRFEHVRKWVVNHILPGRPSAPGAIAPTEGE